MKFGELVDTNVDFRDDLVRNIKTIRAAQDLFDDLSGEADDWQVAAAAEAEERIATHASVITRPFDYGTVIAYSFDASNWQATRFGDGRHYGVWYGSLDVETTVYETVYHWHRFLMDSFPGEDRSITGERRVFDVRCDALLIDLRGKEQGHPELIDRRSYAATQRLGSFLHVQGSNGCLFRSARGAGTNAAIFRAGRLSRVRDRMLLTYRCNPTHDSCRVERASGRAWMQIRPSSLC